jgi:hypothetical protein
MKTLQEIKEWIKNHKCIKTIHDYGNYQYLQRIYTDGEKLFALSFCNGLPCDNDKKGYYEPIEVVRKTRMVEREYYEDVNGNEI